MTISFLVLRHVSARVRVTGVDLPVFADVLCDDAAEDADNLGTEIEAKIYDSLMLLRSSLRETSLL